MEQNSVQLSVELSSRGLVKVDVNNITDVAHPKVEVRFVINQSCRLSSAIGVELGAFLNLWNIKSHVIC